MKPAALPRLAAFAAVLLWSTSAAALHLAGARLPGHVLLAWVYTLSSLSMLPILLSHAASHGPTGDFHLRRQRLQLTPAVAAAILLYCTLDFLHEFAFLLGTRTTSPLRATLINYLWPLWLALLTYPLRRLPASARAAILLPLLLGFAGVAIFAFGGSATEAPRLAPVLLGLASSLCAAGYMVVFLHLAQRHHLSVPLLLAINFLLTAAGLWAADPNGTLAVISIPTFYPILLYLSVFTMVLPELLWAFFLRRQKEGTSALPAFATPLLSAIWLALARRELPGAATIAGGVVILSSLLLANVLRAKLKPDPAAARPAHDLETRHRATGGKR